jgi:hypothetical protein
VLEEQGLGGLENAAAGRFRGFAEFAELADLGAGHGRFKRSF